MLTREDWARRFDRQARWTLDLRRYAYAKLGIQDARAVLEVGCGTGAITSGLGEFTPARVYGVDLDRDRLALARASDPSASFAAADGLRLPFPNGCFDFCLCHFFLLWVARPAQAVTEMARVTRPGGWVLALAEPDYGGRVDAPAPFEPLGRWQAQALAHQGADPRAGRKLAGWLAEAGLAEIQTGVMGGQWSAAPSAEDFASEWDMLEHDLSVQPEARELPSLRRADWQARQNGERVLFVPTFYGWGQAR